MLIIHGIPLPEVLNCYNDVSLTARVWHCAKDEHDICQPNGSRSYL